MRGTGIAKNPRCTGVCIGRINENNKGGNMKTKWRSKI
jgi:hypothetical protein